MANSHKNIYKALGESLIDGDFDGHVSPAHSGQSYSALPQNLPTNSWVLVNKDPKSKEYPTLEEAKAKAKMEAKTTPKFIPKCIKVDEKVKQDHLGKLQQNKDSGWKNSTENYFKIQEASMLQAALNGASLKELMLAAQRHDDDPAFTKLMLELTAKSTEYPQLFSLKKQWEEYKSFLDMQKSLDLLRQNKLAKLTGRKKMSDHEYFDLQFPLFKEAVLNGATLEQLKASTRLGENDSVFIQLMNRIKLGKDLYAKMEHSKTEQILKEWEQQQAKQLNTTSAKTFNQPLPKQAQAQLPSDSFDLLTGKAPLDLLTAPAQEPVQVEEFESDMFEGLSLNSPRRITS